MQKDKPRGRRSSFPVERRKEAKERLKRKQIRRRGDGEGENTEGDFRDGV